MKAAVSRDWATPLTIGAFGLMATGGIEVSRLDQPLDQVTAGDRDREARALNLLFGGAMPPGGRP